ncbi:hypothetical protein CPB86DRAFT_674420, partial [Serendipita vermifera]
DITQAECERALFATAPDKAPGEDGIPTRALEWAWKQSSEAFYTLISKSQIPDVAAGYHPRRHHRSTAVALRKPNKEDYSKPRAWRLVHLLNTLGKWIEKVIANRLLFYG